VAEWATRPFCCPNRCRHGDRGDGAAPRSASRGAHLRGTGPFGLRERSVAVAVTAPTVTARAVNRPPFLSEHWNVVRRTLSTGDPVDVQRLAVAVWVEEIAIDVHVQSGLLSGAVCREHGSNRWLLIPALKTSSARRSNTGVRLKPEFPIDSGNPVAGVADTVGHPLTLMRRAAVSY